MVPQDYIPSQETIQLTFNKGRMYINSYGLSLFPDEDYIRVLVDDVAKGLVIEPYAEKKKDSFRWCGGSKKRKPRHMGCLPLYYLLFRMMKWDMEARYRITGEIEENGNQRTLYFRLKNAQCFQDTGKVDENGRKIIKHSMPEDWGHRYGMPVAQFEGREDIKTFDDMAVFEVELPYRRKPVKKEEDSEAAECGESEVTPAEEGRDSSPAAQIDVGSKE